MPFMISSSPMSSHHENESPSRRKRRKLDNNDSARDALHTIDHNAPPAAGPFLMDDSDDSGDDQTQTDLGNEGADDVNDELMLDTHTSHYLPPALQDQSPERDTHDVLLGQPSQAASSTVRQNHIPTFNVQTCSGRSMTIRQKKKQAQSTYESIIAQRSDAVTGRARKSYYGVDIHVLLEQASKDNTALHAAKETTLPSIEQDPVPQQAPRSKLMWTEKYRARKFTDLVGDERTHRSVLSWLKAWDPIVFPGAARPKPKQKRAPDAHIPEHAHRKVLLLTGPPGLGKTTLAHVCARQAGYEVQEINASDERSGNVVRGRIRDMVATENVRQVKVAAGAPRKAARPVCVVVDEVDGVVTGNNSNGGEGGFIKALVDLLALDARNSNTFATNGTAGGAARKKKGDKFRMLRPLILICNDVYHPSLRLLRQGTIAEIVYVRKPAIGMVVPRMQQIFEREGVAADTDGVRRLCEAAWGLSSRKEDKSAGGTNDGDIRGILVVAEWVASRLRSASTTLGEEVRLSKRWLEQHVLSDLAQGGGGARSIGRGGSKEIAERVFAHNAGFPADTGVSAKQKLESLGKVVDAAKRHTMESLRDLIDSSGEDDRVISDCFTTYPTLPFQDDNYLTKPNAGYEWLNFYDLASSLVHHSQEWEMASYLSSPILAFHHLFASTSRHSYSAANTGPKNQEGDNSTQSELPFSGPRASWEAHEAQKANHAALQHLQGQLSLPLHRAFRSTDAISTELLPFLLRMLAPEVKPVVVGGSEKGVASVRRGQEKEMVDRAVDAMIACGVTFEKSRVDLGDNVPGSTGGWVYRMEPGLDSLGVFETAGRASEAQKVRYSVRQVLEQEMKREVVRREQAAGLRRMKGVTGDGEDVSVAMLEEEARKSRQGAEQAKDVARMAKAAVKRDFFGRVIVVQHENGSGEDEMMAGCKSASANEGKVWVTHREGYSTAVRKGLTLKELLDGL